MNHDSPILLHIPHASMIIPEEERSRFCLSDLHEELLKMTDRYCDELFTGFDSIIFPISRLVCDLERFRGDEQETMSQIGMGAVYTSTSSGNLLRRIREDEREGILRRYYDPHHERLASVTKTKLEIHKRCLIIDGHSFHPTPLPYEPDQDPVRPSFCIGTDPFHMPSVLAETAECFLRGKGYDVEMNRPYSGSMVPLAYYRKDRRVMSLMIEVNRGLYMEENGDRRE